MNRSKDLDNIAPDDLIVASEKPKVVNKKQKKTFPSSKTNGSSILLSKNNSFKENVYDLLGHSKSSFSDFLVNPKILTFAEQEKDEIIYLAARPHFISNISWIATSVFMLFIPLILRYFNFLNFLPLRYRLSAIFFWYLVTFMFAFEEFLSWYFDFYLITNKRIVDVDFLNLLNKHFAQTDISMIQDVSCTVKGFLGTFFNFGDLLIQTASEINQINFEKIPNPSKVIKLIKEIQESDRVFTKGSSND